MSKDVLNNQNSLNNQNQNCSSRGSWMGTNSSTCSNSYTTNYQRFKKQYSDSPILRQILASSLGTCVSVLTLNPISVVKLRLQRQDIFTETTAKGAFRTIYKKDGILGFWAGMIINKIRIDSWLLQDCISWIRQKEISSWNEMILVFLVMLSVYSCPLKCNCKLTITLIPSYSILSIEIALYHRISSWIDAEFAVKCNLHDNIRKTQNGISAEQCREHSQLNTWNRR